MKRLFYALLFIPVLSFAQQTSTAPAKIRGAILEGETRSPISFVDVTIIEANANTLSNDNGYFAFNNLEPGTYTVVCKPFGYLEKRETITVGAGQTITVNLYLDKSTEELRQVEVSSSREEARTKVQTGKVQLTNKQIKDFSVGGDADVVRAMQVVPGVVTTGDQGTQLYIRGGLPIQNLVLMDGMQIFNPFHSIGFYSVFDPDLVETVDIYSASFGAEYGSRNSAVMDVKLRSGDRKHLRGKFQASTFVGKAILEGPLGPKDKDGFANTSFIVSAKSSYLNQTAPILYPYIESQFDGLPFVFNDFYGKLSNTIDGGSSFNGFGFRFDDRVSFQPNNTVGWVSSGGGFDMRLIPPGSTTIIDMNFGFSRYDIDADFGDGQPRESSITGFNVGIDMTYLVGENDEAKFGLQAIGYGTEYNFVNPVGRTFNRASNSTEMGGYFKYRINRNRLIIDPGLRIQYYGQLNVASIEPRIGAKYLLNESIRIKASAGRHSQNLVAAISDREVVNLFYGFLDGNVSLPPDIGGEPINGPLQTSNHAVLGTEIDFTRNIELTVEGYVKQFNLITNVNRNKILEANEVEPGTPEILWRDFAPERGTAYGVDVLFKGTWENLGVWVGYSWAHVTRNDGVIEYYPIFDRRHNLNLVGNYRFGKDKRWSGSFRYNFGSGFPFTPTQGYFPFLPFNDAQGNPNSGFDFTSENAAIQAIFGEVNSARLPYYHRVDISANYTIPLKKRSELELTAGVTNILNRENIFYFDREAFERIDQLPILPTVGAIFSF